MEKSEKVWGKLKKVKPGKWYNSEDYKKEFSDVMLENGEIIYYGWCNDGKFIELISGKEGRKINLGESIKIRKSCYSI